MGKFSTRAVDEATPKAALLNGQNIARLGFAYCFSIKASVLSISGGDVSHPDRRQLLSLMAW